MPFEELVHPVAFKRCRLFTEQRYGEWTGSLWGDFGIKVRTIVVKHRLQPDLLTLKRFGAIGNVDVQTFELKHSLTAVIGIVPAGIAAGKSTGCCAG